jgi:Na+-transporting methylmalonyl-CoA/oxaloacetate decarboxylase gamma subunit
MIMTDMQKGLVITGIGILLVFVGIIILWGIMELLVRLTTKKEKPSAEKKGEIQPSSSSLRTRQAAAAAVAVALNMQTNTSHSTFQFESQTLTPWQNLNRGRANQRNSNRAK